MRKKTNNLIFPLLVVGTFLIFANSCKKDDNNNAGIPVLTTYAVTDITGTNAISGGNIITDGGATITARGVCWSTGQTPTISDNKTEDGKGAGSFNSRIINLEPNTIYYLRAYSTNSAGTGYGMTMSFTTLVSTSGKFTDVRDGNVYNWVKIGNQIWMTENLKYLPSVVGPGTGSNTKPYYYVYGYNGTSVSAAKAINYTTYGVLYNWTAAMNSSASRSSNPSGVKGVCPAGWHLPSDAEWKELTDYLGTDEGSKLAGNAILWTDGILDQNANFGETAFTALPGGYRYDNGAFSNVGSQGFWWSATERSAMDVWIHYIGYYHNDVLRSNYPKEVGFSVRCVKN